MGLRWTVRPWTTATCVAAALLATAIVSARAQDPAAKGQAKTTKPSSGAKGKTGKAKGNRLVPGGPKAKARNAADAIGKAGANLDPADAKLKAAVEAGNYHHKFKLSLADGSGTLAATYYPSRLGTGAAVVLLIHEKDRSSKDFQDPIADLQETGLAEHLQQQGVAVLSLDLRGHGENPRRATGVREWKAMPADLQTAYVFLIDRHNHGELNLGRLGVIALGEGANLVANWAAMKGAASTYNDENKTDLSALVLISPMIDANAQGLPAQRALSTLAAKIPLSLMAGERDSLSAPLVKASEAAVKRYRTNQVKLYPSSLHGNKLLRLEPEITTAIVRFVEETVKAKAETWEPRYNLTPATYSDVKILANAKAAAPAASAPAAPADPAAPKAKAKDAGK